MAAAESDNKEEARHPSSAPDPQLRRSAAAAWDPGSQAGSLQAQAGRSAAVPCRRSGARFPPAVELAVHRRRRSGEEAPIMPRPPPATGELPERAYRATDELAAASRLGGGACACAPCSQSASGGGALPGLLPRCEGGAPRCGAGRQSASSGGVPPGELPRCGGGGPARGAASSSGAGTSSEHAAAPVALAAPTVPAAPALPAASVVPAAPLTARLSAAAPGLTAQGGERDDGAGASAERTSSSRWATTARGPPSSSEAKQAVLRTAAAGWDAHQTCLLVDLLYLLLTSYYSLPTIYC